MHLWPESRFGMSYVVMAPVVPAGASGPEGSAAIRVGLLGAGLRVNLAAPGARWAPSAGAGLSAIWLGYVGHPVSGYVGTSGDVFTVAPYLRAGLGLAVSPRLRARADLLGGATVRRPIVRFGDRVAGVWGAPFFAPTLGVELAL